MVLPGEDVEDKGHVLLNGNGTSENRGGKIKGTMSSLARPEGGSRVASRIPKKGGRTRIP